MKALLALLFSIVVTDQAGQYTREGVAYDSRDACVASAENGLGPDEQVCEQVNKVTIKGLCDDVPMPPEPERVLTPHLCPGNDTRYWFTEDHQVAAPYPACWSVQPVVEANVCNPLPTFCQAHPDQCYTPKWP